MTKKNDILSFLSMFCSAVNLQLLVLAVSQLGGWVLCLRDSHKWRAWALPLYMLLQCSNLPCQQGIMPPELCYLLLITLVCREKVLLVTGRRLRLYRLMLFLLVQGEARLVHPVCQIDPFNCPDSFLELVVRVIHRCRVECHLH